MINGFSQFGNLAGSYIWDLKDNGYRKSYGIVTAMFVVTMSGAWVIRMMLIRLNKKLDQGEIESDWETISDSTSPASPPVPRAVPATGPAPVARVPTVKVVRFAEGEPVVERLGFRYQL